jgi:prepilin-type N-terminal cleavage/methylation domain-containing protein
MQNQKGFTLLECILSIAVISLLVGSISIFFTALIRAHIKNQVILEVESQGSTALYLLTHAIRNAASITLPQAGASAPLLTLAIPDALKSPATFSSSNNTLYIQEGNTSQISLTNSRVQISNLIFQNHSAQNTPGIIRVSFSLSYVNPQNIPEYAYSKTFITSASLR